MTTSTYIPVQRYTDEYCKALTENFKRDSMRSIEYNLKKDPNCTYSKEQLVKIVSGTANLDRFRYYEGKKYLKVVRETFDCRFVFLTELINARVYDDFFSDSTIELI